VTPAVSTKSTTGAFTADAFAAHLAGQDAAPAWWLERKREAHARFASLAMPGRTDEGWRFSSLGGLTLEGFASLPGPSVTSTAASARDSGLRPAATLVFANNRHVPAGGAAPDLAAQGVVFAPFSQAMARHGELLRRHFMAQPQRLGSEKFAALHNAFVGDGAFVYVPRGVEVAGPLVVHHLAEGAGAAVFPHTLVVAEENSAVMVIDRFASVGGGAHFAAGANDLYAAHGARITYVGVQDWSRASLSFQLNSTIVRRDARVQALNLHLGGRQARHESMSQLQAPGGFSEMLALTIADRDQEFDQRTLQVHQAPNTKSDLLYKNALRANSRTIFSGLIVVDPDAQKTDAYQSNRNLMLSDDAEASALPGLEIQANDVRCTHGATTSRIDPEQEFYLKTRGIPAEMADELLIFGFFEEVLARLSSEDLQASLRTLIQSKFKPGGANR